MVGSTLNHYRLVQALGSGGMGDVYLADDARLKRQIALKILPAALAAHPDRRERFEREAQAVAALNHQNIVTIFSVEQSGDTLFLTMEYVDGRTLADLKPKDGLPLKRLLPIASQIVDAVIAAHDRGIVHRDLKPANVMVTAHDRVKVLDFGLAKLREAADDAAVAGMPTREITGEGKIVGTVAYMSPEQAEGKPVDGRSDIFSIGVMLYELATGEVPFKGDTSLSVLSSILRDTPKAVTEVNTALPRDFARIVRRCLAKEPDRRYQSARDLRNELDDLQQSMQSGKLDAVTVPRAAGPSRAAIFWTAAIAAFVAAAGGTVWWSGAFGRSPSAPPVNGFTRLTQAAGIEQFPSLSPDGKWVVYARDGDIFLQSATGQTAINLTHDAGAGNTTPAFSPDGELIAFRSERDAGGIFVMGRTGDSVRRVTASGRYPAWFPDGRRLAYSTDGPPGPETLGVVRSEIWVVEIGSGEPRSIVSGYYAVEPRVSPHGRRVAFWAIRNDQPADRYNRDIWTVDLEGNNPIRATSHAANDWNPVWSPDGHWLYFLSNRGGSMNLWRIAIDESSGRVSGDAMPLTLPAPYVSGFALSADGRIGAYAALTGVGNIGRVGFDGRTATVTGPVDAITTGTHDFFGGYLDVTRDGRYLVAATSARGQEDLCLVSNADGAIPQLTNDFHRDRAPRWSVDDRRVLFYSDRSGNYDVWSIDADGGNLRQLTRDAWRGFPVPSPDGSRIVTDDIETHRLFVYDGHDFSKAPEALPPNPDPSVTNLLATSWSPDGTRILYHTPGSARGGIWMFSFADRTHRRLTDGTYAAWLRDGRRFVFSKAGRLLVYDLSTSSSRDVLAIPGESLGAARFAADDAQLFFIRSASDGDIWLMHFDQK